ncbi:MAG: ACP S-malonyltransferase [Syntrophales bacterium]|nr:ACP S-malonyltransferase [Syntrophales bacterium]MCK9528773.1 ACP S-malonyltransferase [Syntrophales bacterium]MDX9922487.1 ACP S-malonyltransferase [Syntrophales bacterium]
MNDRPRAIVFPGQGCQRPGMGKDFYDESAVARDVYREASEALGYDVAALCFGEDHRLNLSEYSQPCILTTEIAMHRVVVERWDPHTVCFGGHSLGEYTALVAAGVIPFADALRLVQARGKLMQQAAPPGMGGMAALIAEDLSPEELEPMLNGLPVDIANINSTMQVVISGETRGLDEAESRIDRAWRFRPYFRYVQLFVSAPFHSRFMNAIKRPFREVLEGIRNTLDPSAANRVTCNYTGTFHDPDHDSIIERLVAQLSGAVRWTDNMAAIASRAGDILEIGPGRPLREFFKTVNIACRSITTVNAAERVFAGADEPS